MNGSSSAWLSSLLVHLVTLLVFSFVSTAIRSDRNIIVFTSSILEETEEISLTKPEEFFVDVDPNEHIGAQSSDSSDMAKSAAMELGNITNLPMPEMPLFDLGELRMQASFEPAAGLHLMENRPIKGSVGFGTTGAEGAVDLITKEIQLSMEQRKTLVVWFFDQSASLIRQREAIHKRVARIFKELGVIDESLRDKIEDIDEAVLLSSVVAFGEHVDFLTKQPSADADIIQSAIKNITRDDSGIEHVFRAIQKAVARFKKYRRPDTTGEPDRNVLFVLFTDEAGDDQELLDDTVKMVRNLEIPVYVVGVPAPFGRELTKVKWIDPDPKYDQTPSWPSVRQGPESLRQERLQLGFSKSPIRTTPIDSGFGPFSLTRLAHESGGIYFAVHPNRQTNRRIRARETEAYAAHLGRFFKPEIMRRYRPDYVSAREYYRRVNSNAARQALLQAAQLAEVTPMIRPNVRFVHRDDATLANALTESQKAAAKLEPILEQMHETLRKGESDRTKEASPRWQAGYDLAMGRVLATKARTYSYNSLLAKAKRGMKFQTAENNTWWLKPTNDLDGVDSSISNTAKNAKKYLARVIKEHPATPWALIAKQELAIPLVWKWTEDYTNLDPPRNQVASNNNNNGPNTPRDDRRRMLPKPKPKRPAPKL